MKYDCEHCREIFDDQHEEVRNSALSDQPTCPHCRRPLRALKAGALIMNPPEKHDDIDPAVNQKILEALERNNELLEENNEKLETLIIWAESIFQRQG